MTWGNLWRMITGYWIRQDREWDRTRTLLAMMYNTSRGKRRSAKTPQRILPLAIDRMGKEKLEWTEETYNKFEEALEVWDFTLHQQSGAKKIDPKEYFNDA